MLDIQVVVLSRQLISPQDSRGKAQTGSKNAGLTHVQIVLKAMRLDEINKCRQRKESKN